MRVQYKTTPRPENAERIIPPPGSPLAGIQGSVVLRKKISEVLAPTDGQTGFVADLLAIVDRLFAGKFGAYQPIDLKYHDHQHTIQASWTYLDMVAAGRNIPNPSVVLSLREAQLGLAAILLHDTGYLKVRGDDGGTGAKYTYCHVQRSCTLAAALLPGLHCTPSEIEDVLGAIRCTGLSGDPAATLFRTDNGRYVACLVATADYLGQMAAPEYPDKLPYLFMEFAEADDHSGTPQEKRQFKSAVQLLAASNGFWERFVLPKFERDFAGVHKLLRNPQPDGPNPYFIAIERNLAVIAERSRPPFAL